MRYGDLKPATRLRLLRVAVGLRLFDVAEATGINESYLGQAERGMRQLRPEELVRLCVLLGWPRDRANELLEVAVPPNGSRGGRTVPALGRASL